MALGFELAALDKKRGSIFELDRRHDPHGNAGAGKDAHHENSRAHHDARRSNVHFQPPPQKRPRNMSYQTVVAIWLPIGHTL